MNEQGRSEQLSHLSQPDVSTLGIPLLCYLDIVTQKSPFNLIKHYIFWEGKLHHGPELIKVSL